MSALDIQSLSRSFGGVSALSNVSFTVKPGERRLIIGPNGAGKTTLFNLLSGIFAPSAGRLSLFDQDVTALAMHERARLGLARTFQITQLFPRLSVLDNVLLALQTGHRGAWSALRSMRSQHALYERAHQLLAQWQLDPIAGQQARAISYGEQRQVDLMLAMANTPRVLLLDEPMAGLSAAEVVRVSGMIRSLPRSTTILLIEHDMDVAFDLADQITVLHQGRKIAEGDGPAIRADAQVNEIYLGVD